MRITYIFTANMTLLWLLILSVEFAVDGALSPKPIVTIATLGCINHQRWMPLYADYSHHQYELWDDYISNNKWIEIN